MSSEDLLAALHGIADRIDDDMSEKDVENAFLNENFFTHLGYEGAGYDLRSEWTLPDNRRPDYVTLDNNESVTAVYEFKTSGLKLSSEEESQLFHYVDELKADYGILTNGNDFRVYRREDHDRLTRLTLADATESDAADVRTALRKPEWDITDPDSVDEFLNQLDAVELDSELGREHFFDTFRLEEDSPFANLVTAMMDLLTELRDEQETKFVSGAYDFWEASYANIPEDDDIPDSWDSFINGDREIRDFMFCLESGHALLARLLLAKATEDHDFFPTDKGLRRYFDELGGFSGNIALDAYPIAANGMIEDMRNQLVQSLFEDDIFIWWTDGYGEQTASQHKNPYNRFETVAKEGSDVSRVSSATRERFSRAISHISFAVLKFDFTRIEGDPLGNLYQRYFDPETRKALGEFYTPQPVVDYIMDGVDYNVGVSEQRIIDPSCGSGTFLVEAVDRYLEDVRRYHDDPDWEKHLTDLCTRPHIVGLDIHPFAVLMAQIRFMVAILPEYRDAKQVNEDFTIRRLPIFRTDSLRNERELTGIELGDDGQTQMTLNSITEDNQDVKIPVPLPIEVGEGVVDDETEDGFLVQRVRMPKYDTAKVQAGVRNFSEYYAAIQGVLDVVKFHMHEGWWEYGGGLEEGVHRYTTREYEGVEDFFEPYVNDILATVRYLREDHGDGRLFKMFEDTVLALVVKNYMEYDYVVGNPPYVNIKNIPDKKQDWYKTLYDSAHGRFDLYVLFIERGLELLNDSGKLGYITSNKFTRSRYGKEIRRIISSEYSLAQYIEFGDVEVFSDATNFASILTIDKNKDRTHVPYAKVHEASDEDIFEIITSNLGGEEILTESIEISTYPLSELNEDNWRFTPSTVRNVESELRNEMNCTLGEISLGVREGVASGEDDAFIVSPEYAKQNDLEDELLWPIVRGKNVRRWDVKWENELVIYPYNEDGEFVDLTEHPNIKSHLDSHGEILKDRYCFKKGGKGMYEYHGHHPKSMFEGDIKIATPDMATENHFSHTNGFDCFKNTVYVLTFDDNIPYTEKELLGLLNSSVSEFSIKQTSPPLRGKPFRYRYKSQYVNQIPLPANAGDIGEKVNAILEIEKIQKKIEQFPKSYLDECGGEISYIDYTWQTNRNPIKSSIEEIKGDRFSVTAGRTDEIVSPVMDRGDKNERRLRAEYVHTAVNGNSVKSGEQISIPVPKNIEDVERLLDNLERDRNFVKERSVDRLESKINEEVYEIFDISDKSKEIIEKYIEVF